MQKSGATTVVCRQAFSRAFASGCVVRERVYVGVAWGTRGKKQEEREREGGREGERQKARELVTRRARKRVREQDPMREQESLLGAAQKPGHRDYREAEDLFPPGPSPRLHSLEDYASSASASARCRLPPYRGIEKKSGWQGGRDSSVWLAHLLLVAAVTAEYKRCSELDPLKRG
jgi:hypothetical protein